MEFAEVGTVLAFFGGFMAIVAGINYAFRWTNRQFPSDRLHLPGVFQEVPIGLEPQGFQGE